MTEYLLQPIFLRLLMRARRGATSLPVSVVPWVSCTVACAHHAPAVDVGTAGARPRVVAAHAMEAGLSYLVTTPGDAAGPVPPAGWPVVVFLHSLEERGEVLERLVDHPEGQGRGLAAFALEHPEWPVVTVSPLCPARTFWFREHDRVLAVLEDVVDQHPVDPDRVALTGVSMGGMGVWSLATAHPDRFVALAPIAGGVYSPPMKRRVEVLRDVPVWAFHDRTDPSIPFRKHERPVERLQAAGGDVRFTVTDTGEHYIHEAAYSDGVLVEWLASRIPEGDRARGDDR